MAASVSKSHPSIQGYLYCSYYVWLADASKPDSIIRVGKMIKERLGIDPDKTIDFLNHSEKKARFSTKKDWVV